MHTVHCTSNSVTRGPAPFSEPPKEEPAPVIAEPEPTLPAGPKPVVDDPEITLSVVVKSAEKLKAGDQVGFKQSSDPYARLTVRSRTAAAAPTLS